MESFQINASEEKAIDDLKHVLLKESCGPDKLLVDLKTFCGIALPNIPYFLEISPRRHLISWSSLAQRHFESGQISRAATKVLVTLL